MIPAELSDVGLFGSMPRFGDLSIHAVVDLKRAFTRAQLERAVAHTLDAFPVLACCYEPRFLRDAWVRSSAPVSAMVHVVEAPADLEAETLAWARRKLDARSDRPLRVVSLQRSGGSRLVLSLMHLAVDGAGVAAVGHVLGAHLYGLSPSLPVDPRRDVRSALAGLRFYHLPVLVRDIALNLIQPLRLYAAGRRERAFPTHPSAEASVRHLVITHAELAALKARTRARGASINDALIAALARVAAGRSSRGGVAVLYTMDLRRYSGAPRLTAANTSGILTAIVPRAAIGDLARTAGVVAAITSKHREGLAGPAFVLTPIALAGLSPHALVRRLVPFLHAFAVDFPIDRGMMVTNVGTIDGGLTAFGDDIENLWVFGPNIEGLPVPAVVAFGFRGQLHLELFAPPGMTAQALVELEAELRAALELSP